MRAARAVGACGRRGRAGGGARRVELLVCEAFDHVEDVLLELLELAALLLLPLLLGARLLELLLSRRDPPRAVARRRLLLLTSFAGLARLDRLDAAQDRRLEPGLAALVLQRLGERVPLRRRRPRRHLPREARRRLPPLRARGVHRLPGRLAVDAEVVHVPVRPAVAVGAEPLGAQQVGAAGAVDGALAQRRRLVGALGQPRLGEREEERRALRDGHLAERVGQRAQLLGQQRHPVRLLRRQLAHLLPARLGVALVGRLPLEPEQVRQQRLRLLLVAERALEVLRQLELRAHREAERLGERAVELRERRHLPRATELGEELGRRWIEVLGRLRARGHAGSRARDASDGCDSGGTVGARRRSRAEASSGESSRRGMSSCGPNPGPTSQAMERSYSKLV